MEPDSDKIAPPQPQQQSESAVIEIRLCVTCQEEEQPNNPFLQCQGGCSQFFCKSCVLYWKIAHDECPYRCCKPWHITLPPLPDLSIITSDQNRNDDGVHRSVIPDDWDGFIDCPRCHRLGCLYCRAPHCRRRISFEEFPVAEMYLDQLPKCCFCPNQCILKVYQSIDHEHGTCRFPSLYYCGGSQCGRKYCC